MARRSIAVTLLACLSACTAEQIEDRSSHGDFTAIRYGWFERIIGPCPRHRNETRLYGPDDERLARHVGTLVDSPDRKWTVGYSSDPEGGLFILDHASRKLRWVKGCDLYLLNAIWSPNSERVLLLGGGEPPRNRIQILDVASGEPRITPLVFTSENTLSERESWSPNSDAIAFIDAGRYDKTLDLVEIQVLPSVKETSRTPLERTEAGWTRYTITWSEGRALAIPR